MTSAQNILARLLTIAVMIGCVLMLMRLTASAPEPSAQHNAHATDVSSHTAPQPKTRKEHLAAMAEAWTGEISFNLPYEALTPLSEAETVGSKPLFNPSDDYSGLPRSEGVETVAGLCGACHSLAIVMQQQQTEDGWNYLYDWMIEKQGMAMLPNELRTEIIDYLTREFGGD